MNIPGFSAETSLYKTSGRYQIGRQVINLPTQMNGIIHLAMEKDINIFGCAPGSTMFGQGEDWYCVPDPSWDGGEDPGTPSGPFDGGDGGGGGGGSGSGGTEPPPRVCRPARGRIEIQGVLWRQQCPIEQIYHCCKKKADKCIEDCGSSGTSASVQCKNECGKSRGVCVDERNRRGPEVCSL
jgi:hypothetical protein